MCVYMCVFLYVYVCALVCAYVYVFMYVYALMVHVCAHMCVCACSCIFVLVCVSFNAQPGTVLPARLPLCLLTLEFHFFYPHSQSREPSHFPDVTIPPMEHMVLAQPPEQA